MNYEYLRKYETINLPDLRMRLLTERVARLAGERTGVSKSNSYRFYLHGFIFVHTFREKQRT